MSLIVFPQLKVREGVRGGQSRAEGQVLNCNFFCLYELRVPKQAQLFNEPVILLVFGY